MKYVGELFEGAIGVPRIMHGFALRLPYDQNSKIQNIIYIKPVLWELQQCSKLCIGFCYVVYLFSPPGSHEERLRTVAQSE